MPRVTKVTKAQMRQDELMRAKLEMVAARERGEDALLPLLKQRPTLASELIDFSAALAATTAYADVELTPETETIAMQAREQRIRSRLWNCDASGVRLQRLPR